MSFFIHCSPIFHDLCRSHELAGSWAMDRTPAECHAGDLRKHHLPGAMRGVLGLYISVAPCATYWKATVDHGTHDMIMI